MKKHKQAPGDWLSALTIMGRILVAVPLIVILIWYIYASFLPNEIVEESAVEGSTTTVIHYNPVAGTLTSGSLLIFLCGLAILVYVAIKRFRQGLRGEEYNKWKNARLQYL